jgi:hypothetical protein
MNHEVSCYEILAVLDSSCHRLHIFDNIRDKIMPINFDKKYHYIQALKITARQF